MASYRSRQSTWVRPWPLLGLLLVLAFLGHDLLMAAEVMATPLPGSKTAHHESASPTHGETAATPQSHGGTPEHPENCRIGQSAVASAGNASGQSAQDRVLAPAVAETAVAPDSSVTAVLWEEPRWPPGKLRALLQVYRI